ncbi:metallophosphoesterase family protein [Luteolibacter luteus]|uniref:Phosphohydrolase n=1 Tax=Luteolibacter luteus TaxID=2728835 RepID=A0A858RK00_9BACT|nr:metallophosphoesterase [Luteolibacter luteus]QJE97257.1 phosphohydrolase [Luteolibacter luteus]
MKLLFVADLHYTLKQFDWLAANAAECDALIIGGDLLDLAGSLEIDIQIVVIEKYLRRLRELTRVIVSSGNHDGDHRDASGESRARWLGDVQTERLHIDGESIDMGGMRITICPWWDGPVSRAEVEKQLIAAVPPPGTPWIWVYHAAPEGPLSWTGKSFAGDETLTAWIKRFSPHMVLSGHIHNAPFYSKGAWIDRLGETWAFNPGRQIGPSPTALRFDWEKQEVSWISSDGVEQRPLTC